MRNKFICFLPALLATLFSTAQNISHTFLFDSGKYKVAPWEARDFYQKIKSIKADSITIQGHCDSIGNEQYNIVLSKQRVKAIMELLVSIGIKKKNIKITEAFGEAKPIASNNTEQNRLANRRVEVFVNEVPKIEKPIAPKIEKKITLKPVKKPVVVAPIKEVAAPIDLKVATFKAGEKIYLPNLTFQGNRHLLTLEGEEAWKELLQKIKQNPTIKFTIVGHICCTNPNAGDAMDFDTGTPNLSENRAKEIYERLLVEGIDKKRMKYIGKGSTERVFPDELTSLEASLNRRVEILIMK
jgi:outer membrane protein OmpA-like peptidoglycan-associated protein